MVSFGANIAIIPEKKLTFAGRFIGCKILAGMIFSLKTTALREYKTPECFYCESDTCAVICASGDIHDWMNDENGI